MDKVQEREKKPTWSELKHEPSKRTYVNNLIRGMLEKELKLPGTPHKAMVNLGLGKLLNSI